jgi:hypothetical protein
MLTIRKQQMAAFERAESKKFEDRMVIHLKKFFPGQCAALGESKLPETIRYGIKRAAAYGVTAERDVNRYIDLMIVFGRDFDTDQRFSWAGKILRARKHPAAKIQALYGSARKHLKRR